MIRKHTKTDGTVSYTAQVRFKKGGKTVYQETQTFEREKVAKSWLVRRRAELEKPGALEKATAPQGTLADAIDLYTADVTQIGRTKQQVLRALKDYPIASKAMADIKPSDVVELARQLRAENDRLPQTVQNYISHLGGIFSVAKHAYGYDVKPDVVSDALETTRKLGITCKSAKRDRRPSRAEMDRLMAYFHEVRRKRPSSNPMCHIVAFGLFSTRRLAEITRIRWADFEEENSRVLVRDMKHPGQKVGNNVWCHLPDPAMRIIAIMPRTHPEVFPFSVDAIGAAFTRAIDFLEIGDLHFHDLRHEGISRLFEIGWNIPRVAEVSGHRSWGSLQRYSHLREAGDRWAGWEWLGRLSAQAVLDAVPDVPPNEGDELPPPPKKRKH